MRIFLQLLLAALPATTFERSSKRGLVFTPAKPFPADDQYWIQPSSDLTWYYNYMAQPSPQYANISQSKFEFIPMMWGAPTNTSDNTFSDTVQSLIFNGMDIQHVLTFNEPDGPEIVPLQQMGIKAVAPAVTQRSLPWLANFYGNCTSCNPDFIPLHFYGDYKDFTTYVGSVVFAYPNTPIWITEYTYDHQSLQTTQDFFNISAKYLDGTSFIERYSYFEAFRSYGSNVGLNAAMLTTGGLLTSIGSWYLGGAATNNIRTGPGSAASHTVSMPVVVSLIESYRSSEC
ncbi:uncharacterized protein LY89DRAFT_750204 [Mollisia scopiformis]|uniref:Asl1-like glycosyl hydrolase catalytic domain-containing protein n=1 Tax=Mollisia scopiformis TaxID=149040 RepID=A0A194X775_MOLSC|nr:uncharacterized protein LY89DRAFT_750204 [Mollisia scopiformis]KUJ16025.1 hypothetical protein LY89DRAFT_750204 [Mollisia scopiformis]